MRLLLLVSMAVFSLLSPPLSANEALQLNCLYSKTCTDEFGCKDTNQTALLLLNSNSVSFEVNGVTRKMSTHGSIGFITLFSQGETAAKQVVYLADDGSSSFTVTTKFGGDFVSVHSYGHCIGAKT